MSRWLLARGLAEYEALLVGRVAATRWAYQRAAVLVAAAALTGHAELALRTAWRRWRS